MVLLGVMDRRDDDFEFPSIHWGDGWEVGPPLSGWSKLIAGVLLVIFVAALHLLFRYASSH